MLDKIRNKINDNHGNLWLTNVLLINDNYLLILNSLM